MSKWKAVTLPTSGITVEVRAVSPTLVNEIRRQNPAPRPPKQVVQVGEDRTEEVENFSHPDYLQEIEEHEEMLAEKINRLYVRRGVRAEVDTEAVGVLREDMEGLGVTLDPDDLYVFVMHIAVEDYDDQQALYDALLQRTTPTPAAIEAAQDSFRGEVQGA